MTLLNILIVIAFVTEVTLLAVLEKRMWNTVYTPLNILMIPAAVVLLISIVMVSVLRLYPFYYPSILIWCVGLLFFFVPSIICNFLVDKTASVTTMPMPPLPRAWIVFSATMLLLVVYFFHLRSSMSGTTALIGSDEFAEETSTSGLWAHILVLLFALEILCFCYFSRKRWYFLFPILLVVVACVINQVKGWVLIPLLAGVIANIYTARLRITPRLILLVFVGGAGFFFLSYYLSLVVSANKDFTDDVMYFIFKNFFHYFSSGFLGLSMDCDRGILEQQSVDYLFTPFVNVYNFFTGEKMSSSLNSLFLYTTWQGLGTNIRSFMGTIYVYGRWYAPLIVMLYGFVAYFIRVMLLRKQTYFWLLTDAWMSALLFMGWFDYYFALLKPFEAVLFFVLISFCIQFFIPKQSNGDSKV